MGNFEPIPTIFPKPAQIQVQGYSGALSDLEENLSSSFRAMIFQKWTVSRISGGLDAQCHCLSGAPRRRGSLTRGKGLSLTCHFLHAMQRKTILRTGMSPDTSGVVQVHFYTNKMKFWQVTRDVAKTVTGRKRKVRGQNQVRRGHDSGTGQRSKQVKINIFV